MALRLASPRERSERRVGVGGGGPLKQAPPERKRDDRVPRARSMRALPSGLRGSTCGIFPLTSHTSDGRRQSVRTSQTLRAIVYDSSSKLTADNTMKRMESAAMQSVQLNSRSAAIACC